MYRGFFCESFSTLSFSVDIGSGMGIGIHSTSRRKNIYTHSAVILCSWIYMRNDYIPAYGYQSLAKVSHNYSLF